MAGIIEMLTAPYFATVDFVLAAPVAAVVTAALGIALATLVAVL